MASMNVYNVVMYGEDGVGKGALIARYCDGVFIEMYDPTLVLPYCTSMMLGGEHCRLQIEPIGPATLDRTQLENFIQHVDGLLLAYSIASRHAFEEIKSCHDWISKTKTPPPGSTLAVVLIGTKNDLVADRAVSTEEGSALAKELGCGFVETSAKEGTNVDWGFDEVARLIHQSKKLEEMRLRSQQAEERRVAEKEKRRLKVRLGRLFKLLGLSKVPGRR